MKIYKKIFSTLDELYSVLGITSHNTWIIPVLLIFRSFVVTMPVLMVLVQYRTGSKFILENALKNFMQFMVFYKELVSHGLHLIHISSNNYASYIAWLEKLQCFSIFFKT